MAISPGSAAVFFAGLLAAWVNHIPFTGPENRWLLVSLILFISIGALVPFVFIPRGKIFGRELEAAKQRGEMTPELVKACQDPAVAAARWWEISPSF